jgi:hypothetical protein
MRCLLASCVAALQEEIEGLGSIREALIGAIDYVAAARKLLFRMDNTLLEMSSIGYAPTSILLTSDHCHKRFTFPSLGCLSFMLTNFSHKCGVV